MEMADRPLTSGPENWASRREWVEELYSRTYTGDEQITMCIIALTQLDILEVLNEIRTHFNGGNTPRIGGIPLVAKYGIGSHDSLSGDKPSDGPEL